MDPVPGIANNPLIKLAFCPCDSGFCLFSYVSAPGTNSSSRGHTIVELEAKLDHFRRLILLREQRKRRVMVITGMMDSDSPEEMRFHLLKRERDEF